MQWRLPVRSLTGRLLPFPTLDAGSACSLSLGTSGEETDTLHRPWGRPVELEVGASPRAKRARCSRRLAAWAERAGSEPRFSRTLSLIMR